MNVKCARKMQAYKCLISFIRVVVLFTATSLNSTGCVVQGLHYPRITYPYFLFPNATSVYDLVVAR